MKLIENFNGAQRNWIFGTILGELGISCLQNLLLSVFVLGWALAGLALILALFSLMVALSTVFCLLKPEDWWLLVWALGTWGWRAILKLSPTLGKVQ